MKKIISLLAALSLLVMSGCSLAQEKPESGENADRLVGVLVTTEYLDLFDFEAYINDHANQLVGGNHVISPEQTAKYDGRIYAEKKEEVLTSEDGSTRTSIITYEFPEELNGMVYMEYTVPATEETASYSSSTHANVFADPHSALSYKDDQDYPNLNLSATIYYDPLIVDGPDKNVTFYCNPVYQTPDGQVYVTSGYGLSSSSDEPYGSSSTSTIKKEFTTNGNTDANQVAITMNAVPCSKSVRLFHMSADNRVVHREELSLSELPDEIALHEKAAYLIAEIENTQGEVTRSLGNPDESISVFTPYENGILLRHSINIA